ncbi:MAG: hypothetical protein M3Q52_06510 [Pseudomonadota bacterium]|nr:hypothetical protein [Pseudomonadota bacterium]
MRRSALLVPMVLLLLWSCEERTPTVIDGSSRDVFERTSAEARQEIADADRLIFDRAMRTIGGRRHSRRDPDALARVTFDGMTGAQVVDDQKARETGRR